MIGTKEPKSTQPSKPTIPPEKLEQIKAELAKFSIDTTDKEQVRAAGQDLCRSGHNPGYVAKVLKAETGFGFNVRQLMPQGPHEEPSAEAKAPGETQKAVDKEVTKEITNEALSAVRTALSTGKGIEDALGPFAKLYGFENTNLFVINMFDFWDLWHEHVNGLVTQVQQYKWALEEITKKLTPEGLAALRMVSIKEITQSLMMMGAQTGNYPSPEVLKGYLQIIKEEFS